MNLSFDYYHNLNETELYLVNPDGRELFPVVATDRILRLRFNDLSELTFTCFSTTTNSEGEKVDLDYYDYIQTRRRIIATGIGEFIITSVTETDNGVVKSKDVTCSSGQIVLQDKGVYCEDRVYYFYNPSDPTDANYDASDEGAVPSVIGQIHQQLGVQLALGQGLEDPAEPYDEWTVTYISSALRQKARSFKEETCTGYEWLVKSVEEAYECLILFDFRFKTIHAMLTEEVTEKANVLFTFSNFMKEVQVEENSEDIVTVMNCEGTNCDISSVNPTGTKYICDFSYYMDNDNRWMSDALKEKLRQWKAFVDSQQGYYVAHVAGLQDDYLRLTKYQDQLTEISTIYTDLDNAEQKRSVAQVEGSNPPYGTIWCETVETGEKSLEPSSRYKNTEFTASSQITAYANQPATSVVGGVTYYYFTGSPMTGTAEACYNAEYYYFGDTTGPIFDSYCKLTGTVRGLAVQKNIELVPSGFYQYDTQSAAYTNNISQINQLCDDYNSYCNGNVDYHLRPFVSPIEMAEYYPEWEENITVGPEEVDENVATTYSIGVEMWDSNGGVWSADMTPICENHEILTENQVYDYADSLCGFKDLADLLRLDKARKKLIINVRQGSWDDNAAYWDAWFEDLDEIKNDHWDLAKQCLMVSHEVNTVTSAGQFGCGGFKRYAGLYSATAWKKRYDTKKKQLETLIAGAQQAVDTRYAALEAISSQCNIINYFSNTPALLRELGRYWIEGDYTNDNIEVTDETTAAQTLSLALELMHAGELELSKVCQPKLQFSITSVDCSKLYEFRNQMSELELGKIITVEKEEGLWYYPALLEMEYNLDTTDTFSLTFANALRLDDWGYTYGDLMATSSSVSKQVGANWQNMLEYSKDKSYITPLIKNPLSSALRATFANMNNQEFKIDDTGILGRKFTDANQDAFANEQLRIVNNMIIFTDDNWATAKAALGKITYTDSGGSNVTAYGLVAEVLIGSLLLGEALEIRNANSSVVINDGGIVVKQGSLNVFQADTSGNVIVRGNITANAGYIGGLAGFTIGTGKMYSNFKSTLSSTRSGIYLGTDGFSLLSDNKASYVTFNLGTNSFIFSGIIYASGGKFMGDGIDVVSTSGQMSYIDNLGVENLAVRGNMYGTQITANTITLYPADSTTSHTAIRMPYTIISDECFTSTTTTTINFNASVNCSATADYVRFVATVTTGGNAQMPTGLFVTVNVRATFSFGPDYGSATTFSKSIDVYLAKGATSGSTTVDIINRFHVAPTPSAPSSQEVTSCAPMNYTYRSNTATTPVYGMSITNNVVPGVTNTYDLGRSSRYWKNGYIGDVYTSQVHTSSDRRLKTAISYDLAFADRIFNSLKPAVYAMKSDSAGKKRFGFIAQDVADALGENGMSEKDFGIIHHDDTYSLDYAEFAAMNVWEIQQLKRRITELEKQLTDIKEKHYETKDYC